MQPDGERRHVSVQPGLNPEDGWCGKRRLSVFMARAAGERGSISILMALVMVVLLGMAGLAIDVGVWYMDRIALANAMDAAALSGVQELPGAPARAEDRAVEYAVRNGVSAQWVETEFSSDYRTIVVRANRPAPTFFTRLFGLDEVRVAAQSKARAGVLTGVQGAVPLAVEQQSFIYGEQYTLKEGAGGGYSGNYGALALGGRGAGTYRSNLKFGYDGMLRVGHSVSTEPGNMAGPTAEAIEYRIDQSESTSWTDVSSGDPRLVIVPVVDSLDVNGRKDVRIVGFANFYLEGTLRPRRGKGHIQVVGRFLRMAVDGESGDADEYGDYGTRAYALVR